MGSLTSSDARPYLRQTGQKHLKAPGVRALCRGDEGATSAMTPTTAIFGVLAVLITVCALLPVGASTCFGYRAGERLAISIGTIAGLVVLMSCALLAYLPHISEQLSEEAKYLSLFVVFFAGVPALCIFLGTLAGYIAMGFLGLTHNDD